MYQKAYAMIVNTPPFNTNDKILPNKIQIENTAPSVNLFRRQMKKQGWKSKNERELYKEGCNVRCENGEWGSVASADCNLWWEKKKTVTGWRSLCQETGILNLSWTWWPLANVCWEFKGSKDQRDLHQWVISNRIRKLDTTL